jgi:hypothetical protein
MDGTIWYKVYNFFVEIINMAGTLQADTLVEKMNNATDLLLENDIVNGIVIDVMLPIGSVLMVVYFMLDLYDLVTHDNFSVDEFFKVFVKFLVFFMLLINIQYVFEGIVGLSQWISEKLVDSFSSSIKTMGTPAFKQADKDLTIWGFFYLIMENLSANTPTSIGIIEAIIYAIIVYVETWYISFDRAISLGIYYLFAPIACSDIAGNGLKPPIVAYLKKIVSVAMREPIAVIVIVYLPLIKDYMDSQMTIPFLGIAVVLLIKKLLKNVKTYSDNIFINGAIR